MSAHVSYANAQIADFSSLQLTVASLAHRQLIALRICQLILAQLNAAHGQLNVAHSSPQSYHQLIVA
jgi:hypothetical protein